MNPPPLRTFVLAFVIGAFTAVIAAALSVISHVVIVFRKPLLDAFPMVLVTGGIGYLIAAGFGMFGAYLTLAADRYVRSTRLLILVVYAAIIGVSWGDWASRGSPHISSTYAELIAASSFALTAAVVVLIRDLFASVWRRQSCRRL